MKYIIGLFIATVGFILASQHLNQGLEAYWDYVAFFVVLLGTFAVMLVTFPAAPAKILAERFTQKFFMPPVNLKKHIHSCFETFKSKKRIEKPVSIEDRLMNDGLEMIELGFSSDKIQEIISQRFEIHSKRVHMLSTWFRRGAKYPPAFGLAGTVLGLIHLMRGISAGIDTKETGLRMAIALVATFYGLILSNLLLNPIGEWLAEEIKRDEMKSEATLKTLLLIHNNSNIVEAQEVLNSFLDDTEKIKMNFNDFIPQEAA